MKFITQYFQNPILNIIIIIAFTIVPFVIPDLKVKTRLLIFFVFVIITILYIIFSYIHYLHSELSKLKNIQNEFNSLNVNRSMLAKLLADRDSEIKDYIHFADTTKNFLQFYRASPSVEEITQINKLLSILEQEENRIKENRNNDTN